MSYNTQAVHYLEADVLSRSPEWLVPLMYEHLLINLHRAVVQIETNDFEGKANSLEKANAIVMELTCTLDRENGGEIAAHLASLYAYFCSEILTINLSLDTGRLARLIEGISGMHEAWVQAAEQISPRGGRLTSAAYAGAA